MKQSKVQSAGTAASTKTQPTLATTAVTSRDNEVKVENISPDTSPVHHSSNKPTGTSTKTKQEETARNESTTVHNMQDAQNNRTRSDKEKAKTAQKLKKETEVSAVVKSSMKSVTLQKDKPKEPTGYAARYIQKRAAEQGTKTMEQEAVLTAGMLDIDIGRPLLSPATRESMAKKRRCSDKPITGESLSGSQSNIVTSISAPVRRTKHSSLASGKVMQYCICVLRVINNYFPHK